MIGLDTNVLVRFFAKDDPAQAALARTLIVGFTAQAPGFVSTVTLVETIWVLAKAYRTPKAELVGILERLLHASEIVV